jgi:hypothetical protein
MYVQYILGLSQHRLRTADHAETSVQKFVELHRTQLLFIVFHSFILILIIRHVSAHFSGHLQA